MSDQTCREWKKKFQQTRTSDRERRQVKKKKKYIECDIFTWVKENQRCDSCDPTKQGGQANMEDKDNNKDGGEPTTKARESQQQRRGRKPRPQEEGTTVENVR